jgi:hypothetical protein
MEGVVLNGSISKKLASRFGKAKKQVGDLRRQAATDFAQVPKNLKSVEGLVRSGYDPLHAAYIAAQNLRHFGAFTSILSSSSYS